MTFIVYGPGLKDPVPLEKLFERRVEKTLTTNPTHPVNEMGQETVPERNLAGTAEHAYQTIGHLSQDEPALFTKQIMTSPVITLTTQATLGDAIILFKSNKFRHIPVVSSEGMLVGIVSDRDVLRHIGGLTENFEKQTSAQKTQPVTSDLITNIMKTSVLTASGETDVRYIAQLLVEQHVGAIPVVEHDKLEGMITRSDILRAVIRHYSLELWV